VAGRIISKIHARFPQIDYIKLRLTKTAPPMQGEMKGASIELEKSFKPEH
jgi:dihydroneopterin aldolase